VLSAHLALRWQRRHLENDKRQNIQHGTHAGIRHPPQRDRRCKPRILHNLHFSCPSECAVELGVKTWLLVILPTTSDTFTSARFRFERCALVIASCFAVSCSAMRLLISRRGIFVAAGRTSLSRAYALITHRSRAHVKRLMERRISFRRVGFVDRSWSTRSTPFIPML
jgi:hypothetical protein